MTTNVITLLDVPAPVIAAPVLLEMILRDVDIPGEITLYNQPSPNNTLTTIVIELLSSIYPDTWPLEPQVQTSVIWWQEGMPKTGTLSGGGGGGTSAFGFIG